MGSERPMRTTEERDAILRAVSYERPEVLAAVTTVNPNELSRFLHTINNRYVHQSDGTTTAPTKFLGDLSALPLEFLADMVEYLDLQTILSLLRVNKSARAVIQFVLSFQLVTEHVPDALLALLKTGVSNRLILADITHLMSQKNCSFCSSFAGFLFLPTLKRCCLLCLQNHSKLLVTTTSGAEKLVMASAFRIRRRFQPVKNIPGAFDICQYKWDLRVNLVAVDELTKTFPLMAHDLIAPRPRDIYRYMAAIPLAYHDRKTGRIERGVFCRGCKDVGRVRQSRYTSPYNSVSYIPYVYSEEEMMRHFESCLEAKELWAEEGTKKGVE